MSRSHYVYIAYLAKGICPAAAFTVKHELLSWMERQPGQEHICVLRLRDGQPDQPQHYMTTEELQPC